MIRAIYPAPHGAQVLATRTPVIPPITDEMGKHWRQPNPQNFLIDDTHVIMTQREFDQLAEYSTSYPSGVYHGKCWKSQQWEEVKVSDHGRTMVKRIWTDRWQLRWYGPHEDPKLCSINHREIIII